MLNFLGVGWSNWKSSGRKSSEQNIICYNTFLIKKHNIENSCDQNVKI